ncbi:hypothetical protein EDD63_10382 [Breznakia blatticola]|uniref:Uncharacterized protein n=2 Tax=Breznakia blatticola TaxID=1754012 RepID=A0A4R8A827_9FIRM|nr:hypothetical protein EDD63_10382 [Breznakia blatticola]
MQLPTEKDMEVFAQSHEIEPNQNTMIAFRTFGKKKSLLSFVMQQDHQSSYYEERPYKLVVGPDKMVLASIDGNESFVYYKVQMDDFQVKKKHYKIEVKFYYEGEVVQFFVMIDGAKEMLYSSKHLAYMMQTNWCNYISK